MFFITTNNCVAHVSKIYFESFGMKVLYSDEKCTFVLQKPKDWVEKDIDFVHSEEMQKWANDIEVYIKNCYLRFKVLPDKKNIGHVLGKVKNRIKKVLG